MNTYDIFGKCSLSENGIERGIPPKFGPTDVLPPASHYILRPNPGALHSLCEMSFHRAI